jgi:LPXTG-motif cell wall-anchored protein
VRHLVLLASVYVLVAALVLPSPLAASDEPAPPAASVAGEEQTAPAEPEPPAPEPVAAPAPAPEAQQGSAPAPGSPPPPAPTPPQGQPAPAPSEQQAVSAATERRAKQDLGDKRDQRRRTTRRVALATAAASGAVTIQNFAFSPKSITVNVGDTVTWTNEDDVEHSATAKDGSFDTGLLGNGKSRSQTFNTAGTFQYICKPHPFMHGTITVAAASGGGSNTGQSGSSSTGGSESTRGSSSSSGSTESGSSSSGSSSSSGTSSSGSSSTLPNTGGDTAIVAVLGLLMLGLGVALQRRARANER